MTGALRQSTFIWLILRVRPMVTFPVMAAMSMVRVVTIVENDFRATDTGVLKRPRDGGVA